MIKGKCLSNSNIDHGQNKRKTKNTGKLEIVKGGCAFGVRINVLKLTRHEDGLIIAVRLMIGFGEVGF